MFLLAERKHKEKSKTHQHHHIEDTNINNSNVNTFNAHIMFDKQNIDALFKKRLIKNQQKNKKAITALNTNNNSNSSISSALINHTNYSYLPSAQGINNNNNSNINNTNYNNNNCNTKFFIHGNNNSNNATAHLDAHSKFPKRSNSALEEEYYKKYIKTKGNVYRKFVSTSSSAKKKTLLKSPFQNVISANANNDNCSQGILGTSGNIVSASGINQTKNTSVFGSTLNSYSKPKNLNIGNSNHNSSSNSNNVNSGSSKQLSKGHYEITSINKTAANAYPLRNKDNSSGTVLTTSRKNSSEKESNLIQFIMNNMHNKDKNKKYINNNNNNNNDVDEHNHNNSNKQMQLQHYHHYKKDNNVNINSNTNNNGLISISAPGSNKAVIHVKKQISNVVNNQSNINNNNNNNNVINNEHKCNPASSNGNNQDARTKPSSTTKLSQSSKTKSNEQDQDLDNTLNNNDTLLQELNLNLDNNYNNNNNNNFNLNSSYLNNSFDSIYSSQQDNPKYLQYNRDMETIRSYIKKYHKKHKAYPTTKMKFYKYGRLLGKGAFGKVNLSLHVLTGRLVAIKSINKSKLTSERQKSKIKLETSIMKTVSKSDYVVKVFETYETKKHICIVMEYICAGNLLTYIRKRSKLNEQNAKVIFKQIALGLHYIHSHGIVHRDIKLDNILIDLNNIVKICDFGVSKKLSKGTIMKEQCGTPAYMAPELLKGKGYEGCGVDLWSVGVVLYAMLSGTVPFKGNDIKELHTAIMKGTYKQIEDISQEATHLVRALLEVDPRKRITIEQVLYHPWLVNVDISLFKSYNLFTNAEKVLLAKSNVDYRDASNRDDMIENFCILNIDTKEEKEKKNNNDKSIILAPYNSSRTDFGSQDEYDKRYKSKYNTLIKHEPCDNSNKQLKIQNGLIKFAGKVKELNRAYELNNNGEIDNGIVISQDMSKGGDDKGVAGVNGISPFEDNSAPKSKPFTPFNECDFAYGGNVNGSGCKGNNSSNNYFIQENVINDKILNEVANLGYSKHHIIASLERDEFNYATTTYQLLLKYST